jgi:hypothetical protein
MIVRPCPEDRIKAIEERFGQVPAHLADILRHFNGAELFVSSIAFVTIFGISTIPPLPPAEWAPEWTIDQYTPRWRSSSDRQGDWPFAIMNYGGLILLRPDGTVKEWDRSQRKWSVTTFTFDEWLQYILREGDAYLQAKKSGCCE